MEEGTFELDLDGQVGWTDVLEPEESILEGNNQMSKSTAVGSIGAGPENSADSEEVSGKRRGRRRKG